MGDMTDSGDNPNDVKRENAEDTPQGPEPIRAADPGQPPEGAGFLGPRNRPREAQNPNLICPPATDEGSVDNMRWSFADSHMRIQPGGWTHEVTTRELPSSTTIAGVNMRLEPGGVRELHWHKAAEWAFMTAGRARITAVDEAGRTFQDDVGPGDLWYFPSGIPHSIQGLGEEGTEFLLVFDDGNFSEENTFLLSDTLRHMPRDVLAKNFGWAPETLDSLPQEDLFIFRGPTPGPLDDDRIEGAGQVPNWFSFPLLAQEPQRFDGGTIRIADSNNFKASARLAAAYIEIEPGAMREIHWHPNGDEWQYYLEGQARMTVFAASANARTFDFQAGDVGFAPFATAHYVENTGLGMLRYLALFPSDHYEDVSLSQWLALTPHALVAAHLNVDPRLIDTLPQDKRAIVRGRDKARG